MCGIFFYIGKPGDVTAMKAGFNKIRHRGPEDTQFVVRYVEIDGEEIMIVHGFHRLCINGLNRASDQPFNLQNTIYCTNGEVWNSEAIHRETGTINASGSDCECIAPLYRKSENFGKLIEGLDGDYGIAMYDQVTRKLNLKYKTSYE